MDKMKNEWTLTVESAADLIVSTLFLEERNRVEEIKNWDRIFAFLGLDCHAELRGNGFVFPIGKDKEEAQRLRKRIQEEIKDLEIQQAKDAVLRIFEEYQKED